MANDSKQGFLNTLFQWTVKNTVTESKSANEAVPVSTVTQFEEMDDEKRKWLNEALENVTVNPVERLKLCINKIKDAQVDDGQKKEFLNELCHWSEELDLAKDFFTLGGLEVLTILFENTSDDIRIQACSLLATLVQNNDHCQRIIVQSGLQQKLLKIVDESDNPELKTKAVTAISALIRGYTLGQLQLQKYQGVKVLLRALLLPIPRLQNKLCFLISTICTTSPHMKKIFYDNGALEGFISLFTSDSCPDYHQTLLAIMTLSNATPNAISQLTARESGLMEQFQKKLDERHQMIANSEDDRDELDLIKQLKSPTSSSSADSAPVTSPSTSSADKQLLPISS